mmetsp:Transcript_75952/g.158406  ORF Transcript_75952/g.158406 Transcript_75952/m.158406 type:complete len:447 (-) Transcript_75952:116-1456(-)
MNIFRVAFSHFTTSRARSKSRDARTSKNRDSEPGHSPTQQWEQPPAEVGNANYPNFGGSGSIPVSSPDNSTMGSFVSASAPSAVPYENARRPQASDTFEDLAQRQRQEKEHIQRYDTTEAHVWYIVEAGWLSGWKQFVTKNGPIPGPIDNSPLLEPFSQQPKPGLEASTHYRGVNQDVWSYWINIYGGGPVIRRRGPRDVDIYGAPVQDNGDLLARTLPGAGQSRTTPSSKNNQQQQHRRSAGNNASVSTIPPMQANTSASCCDKCDGPHETDKCPHFKKPREKHQDAWTSYNKAKKRTADTDCDAAPIVIPRAQVIHQPGDGSCLFHSLCYHLRDGSTANSLRRDICQYIEQHPDMMIADTPIKDWIEWDSGGTVSQYARRMGGHQWGGGIEMAAVTLMKRVNVHVYEKHPEGYRRISAFEVPDGRTNISVLYQGRMHYDALVLR